MKTKIFIVRHTETVGNIEKRLTGRKDYEVTKKGKELIKKLSDELSDIEFDEIYSSISGRAVKTVEQIAKKNNIEIKKSEELCEMYFGEYDGWKWEDVNKIQPEIKQTQNEINEIIGIPNQESMEHVANRMYEFIMRIIKENEGKTILISSHGVAIEAFLRKITNVKFRYKREEYCQYNVAINELEYEDGEFKIIQLANVKYLEKGEKVENDGEHTR